MDNPYNPITEPASYKWFEEVKRPVIERAKSEQAEYNSLVVRVDYKGELTEEQVLKDLEEHVGFYEGQAKIKQIK